MKRGCGILFYKDNQVLVYRRDNIPSLPFAGHLDLIGGHVEHGETPDHAVQREVAEELFDKRTKKPYRLQNHKLFRIYTDSYGFEQHIYYVPADFELTDVELREGHELQWITKEILEHEELAFQFNGLVELFFDFLTAT